MIIALAGHVDHGKTSLIRALTGVETDRLPAEKARGLTIDLGFAYHQFGPRRVGFVDVPGHHRFVHNMLAGIAPTQHALLVVAADDGVMPQTREHLRILELLGIEQGVIALTKSDLATAAQKERAIAAIAALTEDTFLAAHTPIAVSSVTGAGLDELQGALLALADSVPAPPGRLRLAVDRAFSQRGTGTIVTGTVRDGRLGLEQAVTVFPSQVTGRARSLHVNGQPAELAQPGDRCAVNLAGVELADVNRGSWLTDDQATGYRTIVIDYQQHDQRALKHWRRVHGYHGTSHALAQAALLEQHRAIAAGAGGLLQLELDDPLLARLGDRVLLRDHGLELTLGGGRVVELIEDRADKLTEARGRRRAQPRVRRLKQQAEHSTPTAALAHALVLGPLSAAAYTEHWGLTAAQAEVLIKDSAALRFGDTLIAATAFNTLVENAAATFSQLCKQNTDNSPGAAGAFLKEVPSELQDPVLKVLLKTGRVARRGNGFAAPATRVVLTNAEAALLRRLNPHLTETPPPSLGDIAKREGLTLDKLKGTLKALAGKKQLVLMPNNRALLPEDFRALGEVAQQLGTFDVKAFRDACGFGRNLVITILETMDGKGFTRRNGDQRTVVADLDRLD